MKKENGMQRPPVRKLAGTENKMVSHAGDVPAAEKGAPFDEPNAFNPCTPGVLCKPTDHFEQIEKCTLCGKLL